MKNNTKMTDNKNRFTPLLMSLCVVIGIVIGSFYANHFRATGSISFPTEAIS